MGLDQYISPHTGMTGDQTTSYQAYPQFLLLWGTRNVKLNIVLPSGTVSKNLHIRISMTF